MAKAKEWQYIDDPAPTPAANEWSFVEDTDLTPQFVSPPDTIKPTEASGLATKAWQDTVGENVGIDASNQELVKRYSGLLYPLLQGGATILEGAGGALNAGIAGGTELLGNLFGARPGATEDAARGLVDLTNIGGLFAGGHGYSGASQMPRFAPDVEAHYVNLLKKGTPDEIEDFVRSQEGFEVDPAEITDFVKARDEGLPVTPEARYAPVKPTNDNVLDKVLEPANDGDAPRLTIEPTDPLVPDTGLQEPVPTGLNDTVAPVNPEEDLVNAAEEAYAGEKIAEPVPAGTKPPSGPSAVEKLTQALKEATPLRKEQEALYSKNRSERLAKMKSIRATTGGEEGYRAELAQLKGEMDKVDYAPILDRFTEEDVTQLFDTIKNAPDMTWFETLTARRGLTKMFEGKVPTNGEINLLSQVFPKEMVDNLLKNRDFSTKFRDHALNVLNLPRAMMSTLDLSAPFRQGIFLSGRKEFYTAFPEMFKQFAKGFVGEEGAAALKSEIRSRPTYEKMEEAKLSLTDHGKDIGAREEQFMSNLAEKIPGFGRLARGSERAFSGFLNKLRADVFDTLYNANPEHFDANPKALQDLGDYINNATGRGNLGKISTTLERSAPMLNAAFFSPRLMASRVNLLRPDYYIRLDPVVRKAAVADLLKTGAITGTILSLFDLNGFDIEKDSRSSDFGKIKTGNTRYDIFGGFQQYAVLATRLATNETKTISGKVKTLGADKYKPETRLSTVGRFFRSKESPIASFISDYLAGENVVGEPFEAKKAVVERFIPMFVTSLAETMKEYGPGEGSLKAAPGFFGVGVQTFKPKEPKAKKEEWNYVDETSPTSEWQYVQ